MSKELILGIVSVTSVVIFFLFLYIVFRAPRVSRKDAAIFKNNLDPRMKKLLRVFGPDMLGVAPKQSKKNTDKIKYYLTRSGNPWDLTTTSFYALRLTLGAIGLFAGTLIGVLSWVAFEQPLISVAAIVLSFVFGWHYPTSYHIQVGNRRERDFIRELPEAIDLLSLALSGGNFTLINGIKEIIPYLSDGPLKDEFTQVVRDNNSGMSVSLALTGMANRAPTEGIQAFVKALNNASKLDVEMISILEARAEESRKELNDEADKRIAALPVKVMMLLSPASGICVGGVAIAPAIFQILDTF